MQFVKTDNKMPGLIILAEIFLIAMCISYIFKINGLFMDIAYGPANPSLLNILLLEMDVIFLVLTIFAALSISSRRSESWKKVVRTCFTFTFAMILSSSLMSSSSYSHQFDINPYVAAVLLGILVLIMLFSKKVKAFYTPPMTEIPRLRDWIIFIVYGKLFDTEYHITFSNDGPGSGNNGGGPDFGIPDELGPLVDHIQDIPGH